MRFGHAVFFPADCQNIRDFVFEFSALGGFWRSSIPQRMTIENGAAVLLVLIAVYVGRFERFWSFFRGPYRTSHSRFQVVQIL